jgi:Co/Zn/Cd efflux system component
MTGNKQKLRRFLLPLGVFMGVAVVHYVWSGLFPEVDPAQARWASLPGSDASWLSRYLETQGYWLGYSYALSLTFAAAALRRYREERFCSAKTLAFGGVTLSGFLALAGCFLVGCCGSPMLVVYLSLFGAGFLPLAKPLVAVVTTISIVGAWWWMKRRGAVNWRLDGNVDGRGSTGNFIMRKNLHQKALWLSYLTVVYNILEGLVSILAGWLAGSIALWGFGLDSLVESFSGGVMIWRFRNHANLTQREEERLEKKAIRLVGYAFFILAAYVLYESAEKLLFQEVPAPSLLGIIVALVSLIVMPGVFYIKYRTGKSLGSASLMADSKQTLACAMLSLALFIGLGLNYLYGIWQADPIIGILIAAVLIREGYEALKKEKLCTCCSMACEK